MSASILYLSDKGADEKVSMSLERKEKLIKGNAFKKSNLYTAENTAYFSSKHDLWGKKGNTWN